MEAFGILFDGNTRQRRTCENVPAPLPVYGKHALPVLQGVSPAAIVPNVAVRGDGGHGLRPHRQGTGISARGSAGMPVN